MITPCSFDQLGRYELDLKQCNIEEAWNSDRFDLFRTHLRDSCPTCSKRTLCMGGCPLMPEIVFCDSEERK